MTLQNRVLPTGEIIADPARGLLMGNRGGALHGPDRRLGRARWRSSRWISCVLEFRGRRRELMAPGRYTELFFLDEAVALAAGHRPCAECRRAAFLALREAGAAAWGARAAAADVDGALHAARLSQRGTTPRGHARHRAAMESLPDGTFVFHAIDGTDRPCLVRADALHPFAPDGYGAPLPRPTGPATVLTPAPVVAALASGYRPIIHPTAE